MTPLENGNIDSEDRASTIRPGANRMEESNMQDHREKDMQREDNMIERLRVDLEECRSAIFD